MKWMPFIILASPLQLSPAKLTPHISNGGLVQMIFLCKWVICLGFNMLIFRGIPNAFDLFVWWFFTDSTRTLGFITITTTIWENIFGSLFPGIDVVPKLTAPMMSGGRFSTSSLAGVFGYFCQFEWLLEVFTGVFQNPPNTLWGGVWHP